MPGPPPPAAVSPGEPVAFLDDSFLPLRLARLPLDDGLVAGGRAVTERLRTFAGAPFALDRHLVRLTGSAAAALIDLPCDPTEIADRIAAVVRHNYELAGPGEELSVGVFVSAGSPGGGAVLGVHTSVLEGGRFAGEYRTGIRLAVPATRQIPAECLSPHIKTRSRLHWHVAARQAAALDPAAEPLLLHLDGTVAETDTGNVLGVRGNTILTPPAAGTLGGITRALTRDLAAGLNYEWREEPLTPAELAACGEVILTSTTPVLLPVVALDGARVGRGEPGPAFAALLAAWERHVGVRFASLPRDNAAKLSSD